ncbi:MAG: hypothetical protein ACFFA1_06065 [Promethearchaeota archaeon]
MGKGKEIEIDCNINCPYLCQICVSLPTAAETCCGVKEEAPTFKE